MAVCSCCGGTCASFQLRICLGGICCRNAGCTQVAYLGGVGVSALITGPNGYSNTVAWPSFVDPRCMVITVPAAGTYNVVITYHIPRYSSSGVFYGTFTRTITTAMTVGPGQCLATSDITFPTEMCVNDPEVCACEGLYPATITVKCVGNSCRFCSPQELLVASATVTLSGPCGTYAGVTNSSGVAVIPIDASCAGCTYSLSVTKSGYAPFFQSNRYTAICGGAGGPGSGGYLASGSDLGTVNLTPLFGFVCAGFYGCGCDGEINSSDITITAYGLPWPVTRVGCGNLPMEHGIPPVGPWGCYWCAAVEAPDVDALPNASVSITPSLAHHLPLTLTDSELPTPRFEIITHVCPGPYVPTPQTASVAVPMDPDYVCWMSTQSTDTGTKLFMPVCRTLDVTGQGTGTVALCGGGSAWGIEFGTEWAGCARILAPEALTHGTFIGQLCPGGCSGTWDISAATVTAVIGFGKMSRVFGEACFSLDPSPDGFVAVKWATQLARCFTRNPDGFCSCTPCCAVGDCADVVPVADGATYTSTVIGGDPCHTITGDIYTEHCTLAGGCAGLPSFLDTAIAMGVAYTPCDSGDTITATVSFEGSQACPARCGGHNIALGTWTFTCAGSSAPLFGMSRTAVLESAMRATADPVPADRPRIDPQTYITTARLAADTRRLLERVPPDIDCVAGAARSGLIPAAALASYLHLPLITVSRQEGVVDPGRGGRLDNGASDPKSILLVDDTVALGREMALCSAILRERYPDARIHKVVVYAHSSSLHAVDDAAAIYDGPHFLEWNWNNAGHGQGAMLDFDGILCREPTAEECADDALYRQFLLTATPLYLPRRVTIPAIVTGRDRRWEAETRAWLDRWGIRADRLIMRDFEVPPGADWHQMVADWKADHYIAARDLWLFAESEPAQARRIARRSGKPVLCPAAEYVFHDPLPQRLGRPILFLTEGDAETIRHAAWLLPRMIALGTEILGLVSAQPIDPGPELDRLLDAGVLVTSGRGNADALGALGPIVIRLEEPPPGLYSLDPEQQLVSWMDLARRAERRD